MNYNENKELRITKLHKKAQLNSFDCGNPSLNEYLKIDSYYEHVKKIAATHIIYYDSELIGYFTLKVTTIEAGLEKFGAIEIKNLCIDKKYQRQNFGTSVLGYIIEGTLEIIDFTGIRYLSLNALKEKVGWYRDRGFEVFDKSHLKGNRSTIRMYMDFQNKEDVDELACMY